MNAWRCLVLSAPCGSVVRYVSDIIAVMNGGKIVECGPAMDVLASPSHDYTRDLLAAVPDLTTRSLS